MSFRKVNLEQLLDEYRSGWSLEQPFYTSEEIFAAEWQHIFKKHWLFAGNTAQIPRPGDYFLYRLQNDSIVVIHGNNGEIHALYNTCRHRGSLICLNDTGHVTKLICPYHQWVYDKDGTLLNARMMPADFDRSSSHLHCAHIRVVEGLIFLCLAEVPPDFSSIDKSLSPFLKPYQIGKAKVACIKNYELRGNWKLIAENFRECYHCGGAHPEYCSAVIGANLREDVSELTDAKQREWSAKGLHTQLIEVDEGTTTYAIRYPLRPGIESYSIDGGKISIPMGRHRDHDAGVVGLVNYPNFWMDAVSDYVWTMRVTPLDAGRTAVQFSWLVDAAAAEGQDYTTSRLTEFWEVTGEQDGKLCENNYAGIQSSAYMPGPYAPVEDQVINFVDWCVARLREGISTTVHR